MLTLLDFGRGPHTLKHAMAETPERGKLFPGGLAVFSFSLWQSHSPRRRGDEEY